MYFIHMVAADLHKKVVLDSNGWVCLLLNMIDSKTQIKCEMVQIWDARQQIANMNKVSVGLQTSNMTLHRCMYCGWTGNDSNIMAVYPLFQVFMVKLSSTWSLIFTAQMLWILSGRQETTYYVFLKMSKGGFEVCMDLE